MKKNYLTPSIEECVVEVEQGIAQSSYSVGIQDLTYDDGGDEYLM